MRSIFLREERRRTPFLWWMVGAVLVVIAVLGLVRVTSFTMSLAEVGTKAEEIRLDGAYRMQSLKECEKGKQEACDELGEKSTIAEPFQEYKKKWNDRREVRAREKRAREGDGR